MTSTQSRTEEVFVLYASQLGTTKAAAEAFCDEMTTQLSSETIQSLTNSQVSVTVVPTCMTLDEFLEDKSAAWTRLVVIFVSSYGRGDPPEGGYRFRDLCDMWVDHYEQNPAVSKVLTGLQYALCGMGNSSFRTYFQNPQTIDDGLTLAGANRVGDLGKADASGKGEMSQQNVITKWKEGIWKPLAEVIAQEPLSEDTLKELQDKTNALKY